MNAVCIIADLVKSRKIESRGSFQESLDSTLQKINQVRGDVLLSPFTITLGDEFQAIYTSFTDVLSDIMEILYRCYPQKIRFAVSYGEIATKVNRTAAIGMDGPGFYAARDALTSLKPIHGSIIEIIAPGILDDRIALTSLRAVSYLIDSWNDTSLGVCAYSLRGLRVKDIREEMRTKRVLSEKTVYKAISTHGIASVSAYFTEITDFLNKAIR